MCYVLRIYVLCVACLCLTASLPGYQICLKLLRCGATLVATSRFPRNTAARYACEPDFVDWSPRLHVYGIDLRIIADIDGLVDTITSKWVCLLDWNSTPLFAFPQQMVVHDVASGKLKESVLRAAMVLPAGVMEALWCAWCQCAPSHGAQ
jgi:hypothetical protein